MRVGVLAGGPSNEREISLKSGRAVYDTLIQNDIDAIFLDVCGDVCDIIRKNNIDTRLVMITGYTEIDKSFMETIGVDEYLSKPVKLTDVDVIIEKYSKK